MQPCKTYLFDIDKNNFEKFIWHLNIWQLFDSSTKQSEREILKILNINDVRYTARKLAWRGGCRMRSCQEIKCFWRTLSCLNIMVKRRNFGARKEILSFAFLFLLWNNASQKLRISSHFAKCEPLIRTLYYIYLDKPSLSILQKELVKIKEI